MSAQDNTEKVLKSLHVMIAKGQSYELDPSKVVVDRDKMLSLLKELNQCMYAMMEEYELTRQSKDKAEREFRKRGDEIVMDASRKAEDIYAASVIYTDEALSSIQEIMQKANDSVKAIYNEMDHKMEEQKHIVRTNQLELKSQLQDLKDTDKYLKMIEDRNREIQKEKDEKEGKKQKRELKNHSRKESSIYANRQTEIKVNPEYFEKAGIPMVEDLALDDETDFYMKEEAPKIQPEIKVNLDAEYFRWKNGNKKK